MKKGQLGWAAFFVCINVLKRDEAGDKMTF